MATPTHQRVFIVVLAVVMLVGTVGSFAALILANQNQSIDTKRTQKASQQYQKELEEYQLKLDAQAQELTKKYYAKFSVYKNEPAAFNPDSVKELIKRDLIKGDGPTIDNQTKFAAYYIGWNPKGQVFDQSLDDNKLKAPIRIDNGLDSAMLISGWVDGMQGMKIGGVRQLTIPADEAYGDAGQGDLIPPNTPLRFIVMAIELPKEINEPDVPEILQRSLYGY